MIIVLNGASSSGKTTLARALQASWEAPLVYLSLDGLIGMLPFHYSGSGSRAHEGVELYPATEDGYLATGFRMGPAAHRLNLQLARFAASVAADGFEVVVDHIFLNEAMFAPFREALDLETTYLVGVRCTLDEQLRREAAREDRMPGLARFQSARVHWIRPLYDLDLDTTGTSPDTLAAEVVSYVRSGQPPRLAAARP